MSTVSKINQNLYAKTLSGAACSKSMDEDLQAMSQDQLIDEVKKLRKGIREHRDSTGHALCWHHPQLWALLPEKTDPQIAVPEWPVFMRGCIHYRESLDTQQPEAPRISEPFNPEVRK